MEQTADVQVVWNERKEEPLAYMTCWWRWMEQWLAMPLPAGTKALVVRHFVVVTTGLNKAMRSMVLDSAFSADILQLLKKPCKILKTGQLGSTIATYSNLTIVKQ